MADRPTAYHTHQIVITVATIYVMYMALYLDSSKSEKFELCEDIAKNEINDAFFLAFYRIVHLIQLFISQNCSTHI